MPSISDFSEPSYFFRTSKYIYSIGKNGLYKSDSSGKKKIITNSITSSQYCDLFVSGKYVFCRDEKNVFKGIKTKKGEIIKGKILLSSPEYMLKFNKVKKKGKIIRRIIISQSPIPGSNIVDSCQIIIPKKQTGLKNDIFVLQLGYGHCVSRKGYYIIFISCWDDGRDINQQLKPVMDVLGLNKDMIEIFDMNCEYYEPINKNFDDNIFISNSFLPQSHFEDDYKDIIDEFQKITDAKLLFDKIKK
jgi:Rab GDP dissociation inhibitor